MSAGTFFVVAIVLLVGYVFFEQIQKKNQVYCSFRRPNRTKIEKWVKLHSKYVIFEGGKYRVNPKKITLLWWNRGILGMFGVGFWVPSLDYRWDTDQPLDPDTFETTWDTPEVRNMLGSEEDYKDFAKGAPPAGAKKEGVFQRFLPWIMLAILLVLALWIYQMQGQLAGLMQLIKVK